MKHNTARILGTALLLVGAAAVAGNWNVPTHAKDLRNPVGRSAATESEAKQIYAERCVSCHGVESAGDGRQAQVEYDLRDIVGELTDGELFWKITHGVGRMPSYAGSLSDRERWLMVNHLRVLTEARAAAKQADKAVH